MNIDLFILIIVITNIIGLVTGVSVIAYFQYKISIENRRLVSMLGKFKVSTNPFQLGRINEIFDETKHSVPEEKVDPIDEDPIPNLSEDALSTLRSKI